jgi:HEAT repeat protein
MKSFLACLLVFGFLSIKESQSSVKKAQKIKTPIPEAIQKHSLFPAFLRQYKDKESLAGLRTRTMKMSNKAVPLLTYVMKSKAFPDKNRWVATFALGQIMGVKSAPYLSKFTSHPNWMMRLASLKTLMSLNQRQYKGVYTRLLSDKAMIVRLQALETIKQFELKSLAPFVWAMLYDKNNYSGSKGGRKRGEIIRSIIKTVGDLKFKKALKPMLGMIQKKKYQDIHTELDYALSKITEKTSPGGGLAIKKHFWKKESLKTLTL